jgi:oligoendopeptidase F
MLAIALALLAAGPQDPLTTRWDLSSLYANDAAWDAERTGVRQRLITISALAGTLGRSARSLADGLDAVSDLRSRAGKMAVFGVLVSNADTRSERAREQAREATALEAEVEAAVGFAEVEVRRIPAGRLARWQREEPRLARHLRRIRAMRHNAAHALPPEAEAALRGLGLPGALTYEAHTALFESDIWPLVGGRPADAAAWRDALRSAGPERAAVIEAHLGRLRSLENLFGVLFTRRIAADDSGARRRSFRDGSDALLFKTGVPQAAFDRLLETVRGNLALVHRNLELRRRALGMQQLAYPDVFRAVPITRTFTVGETMSIAVAAAQPIGPAYQAAMREKLSYPRWDLAPRPGKRAAAYGIWPGVGGAERYGLMTYLGDVRSSSSLAGLIAAMMKDAGLPRDRAPDTSDDQGQAIYGNSLVFAGRILHDDYLTDHAAGREERMAFLVRALDDLRAMVFDKARLLQFELEVRRLIAAGNWPSGAQLSALHLSLLRQWYGPSVVDGAFAPTWALESLAFESDEDQNFPLAFSAAATLVERVRAGDARARAGFSQLFGRTDSDLSYDLLRAAGVDLATRDPYNALIRRMEGLLDDLERQLR